MRLTDPQISRVHVELLYRDGRWVMHSLGRNGTRMNGAVVREISLSNRDIFQLASSGPSFQFVTENAKRSPSATINAISQSSLDFLMIDEQRTVEEVQKITEAE
jgi:pSer/pThr/pTyr-binding forkhead associated (FHA) protein